MIESEKYKINRKFLKIVSKVLFTTILITIAIIISPETRQTIEVMIPIESVDSQTILNVQDYGAVGDGVTDDAFAIQNAINDASLKNAILLIPKTDNAYVINSTIELRNNTIISGYGATVFMPSQNSPQVMLFSPDSDYITDVSISGLNLQSTNDQVGRDEIEGSMTSYVQGIYLMGIENLTINDVIMQNMYNGLKLGEADNGILNKNIVIDNLQIYNARIAALFLDTKGIKIANSVLDAKGGASQLLHCLYLSGNTSDIKITDTKFQNASGGALNIYNGYSDKEAPTNISIVDCSINNTKVGMYIYKKANNIRISNLKISEVGLAFDINKAQDIYIGKVTISRFSDISDGIMGGFSLNYITDLTLTEITVDSNTMGGSLFMLINEVNDLTVDDMKVKNLSTQGFFNSQDVVNNLVVKNSIFEWSNINTPGISFLNDKVTALFENNKFYNYGPDTEALINNYPSIGVVVKDNKYRGFIDLFSVRDMSNNNHMDKYSNTKLFN